MGISISEAARVLCMSQQEVYQQLKNGQLRSENLDGRRVISGGALLEYRAKGKHLTVLAKNNNYSYRRKKLVKKRAKY